MILQMILRRSSVGRTESGKKIPIIGTVLGDIYMLLDPTLADPDSFATKKFRQRYHVPYPLFSEDSFRLAYSWHRSLLRFWTLFNRRIYYQCNFYGVLEAILGSIIWHKSKTFREREAPSSHGMISLPRLSRSRDTRLLIMYSRGQV